jgi:hypothetical protein
MWGREQAIQAIHDGLGGQPSSEAKASDGGSAVPNRVSQLPAADWFPDPKGEARLRYWDGKRWTEHTAS